MRYLQAFLLFILFSSGLYAQEGCEISIRFKGYTYDTLWLGRSHGREADPLISATKGSDGYFRLKSADPLPSGMYAILFRRRPRAAFEYVSCWLADGQRQFTMELTISNPRSALSVTESMENQLLHRYLKPYYTLKDNLESRAIEWKGAQDETTFRAFREAEEDLRKFQEGFAKSYAGSLTAGLVDMTLHLTPADLPADWKKAAAAHQSWQRAHYFERMDLSEAHFLEFPLKMDRVEFYSTLLPPPDPAVMISMIEDVLVRMIDSPDNYRYYFEYMLDLCSKITRFRIDEVYVYFVRQYLEKVRAGWLVKRRSRSTARKPTAWSLS